MRGRTTRRRFVQALGGTAAVGTTGYLQNDPTNVGMVYATGGLGDNSFNDMAHNGVQRAAEQFDVQFKNAEPGSPSDVATLQRQFAQSRNPNYELICCIGFVQANALRRNARRFPNQKWMVVDTIVQRPNVASYVFEEHLGSFQVGHLAGMMTTMDFSAGGGKMNDATTVGFVGGKEIPLIKKFEAGYLAGVQYANPDVNVLSAYAGAWNDPAKGQSIATSMYDEGADVIYHAAGGTGTGVFKAAQSNGRYAIGVDADQSRSLPQYANIILASMVKHVDNAVFRSIRRVTNDEFTGGKVHQLGLEKNGVEAVYGNKLEDDIPKKVKNALRQSEQKIISGAIDVPTKPSNVGQATTSAN